jgi:negative regulator of flagellin synthesis FlgM
MKIDGLSPNSISPNQTDATGQVKNSSAKTDQSSRVQSASTDRAELSERARLMGKARAALQNTPDVNQEKVDEIKQRVDGGTYEIPAEELARRLQPRVNQIPPE